MNALSELFTGGDIHRPTFPICVVDTETNGLPEQPDAAVVELGAVVVDHGGAELASWSSLVRPATWPADCAEAMAVHGIPRHLIEAGPHPQVAAVQFLNWWFAQGMPPITSWRLVFDLPMLHRMAEVMAVIDAHLTGDVHLLALASFTKWGLDAGDAKHPEHWPSLRRTTELLHLDTSGRHRALPDARLAAQVAVALYNTHEARHLERTFERART